MSEQLTPGERQFLTFALDEAADQMACRDGFTAEDHAALERFRQWAADPEPAVALTDLPMFRVAPLRSGEVTRTELFSALAGWAAQDADKGAPSITVSRVLPHAVVPGDVDPEDML